MPKSSQSGERSPEEIPKRLPPAKTRERRSQQLYVLAENLVEERLRKGTASPTEVVTVLRQGTLREQADLERIKAQTAYLEAQRAKAESETVREEMFTAAMEAMTRYQGKSGRDADLH